jgi:hypothetical protein
VIQRLRISTPDRVGNTDQQHARRPNQPIVGTEECAFNNTRGIYFDDREKCYLRACD